MSRNKRFFYDVRQYVVVFNKVDEILLLQVPDTYKDIKGCWTLPGGRLEPKDSPKSGVEREVQEETGLKIAQLEPFYVARWNTKNSKKLALFYHANIKGARTEPKLSAEHGDYAWVTIGAALRHKFYNKHFKEALKLLK